jgi:hypothetical protein
MMITTSLTPFFLGLFKTSSTKICTKTRLVSPLLNTVAFIFLGKEKLQTFYVLCFYYHQHAIWFSGKEKVANFCIVLCVCVCECDTTKTRFHLSFLTLSHTLSFYFLLHFNKII